MSVRWSDDAAAPDAAPKPELPRQRWLRGVKDLRDAGYGIARGGIAVALVLAVLVLGLRHAGQRSEEVAAVVVVKAPTFNPVPAPPPTAPPAATTAQAEAPDEAGVWYFRRLAEPWQQFSLTRPTGGALCAELAAAGFPEAAWTESKLFPGEWECFSPAEGDMFMILRGRSDASAGSVMLKLNAASPETQAAFRARAGMLAARLLWSTGTAPDAEIAARLAGWQTGTFKHGLQTLRIVKQHGRDAPNAVHFAILQPLPLPPADAACGPECFPLAAAPANASKGPRAKKI
jgi:hypothetical protein